MADHRILILGGTAEARALAARLGGRAGLDVTLSLAGRTRAPAVQPVRTRTGGFGGAGGLAAALAGYDVLVDATHPFAQQITANARAAAAATGTPLLRLARPPWQPRPGDRWTRVASLAEAARALGPVPLRVFLAIGRQEAGVFRAAPEHHYLLRAIDPPEADALPGAEVLLARGPFTEPGERALLGAHRIDVVVAKNSGGGATYAKLAAARALGLPVVLVDRAPEPAAAASVDELVERLDHLIARGV